MASLSETQLLHLLLALGVVLVAARGLGEVARRLGLPEVLGQLVAGVLLGPSALGPLLPGAYDALFGDPPAANGLSAISWLGALLIFLSAGTEADLRALRPRARAGLLVAAGAVLPALAAGTLLGWLVLGQPVIAGLFLGVAMSVTAVSVLVAILEERGSMRRDYGQVLLAAGVTTEMTVWVFIPVVSALLHGSPSPVVAALVATAGVVGVFLFMLTVGQRGVHALLRVVADRALISRAPISVILAVTLLAGALTEALGLHPLLGAFAAGMVLVRAPRVRPPLLQSVQTLTTGFLAPLFFAFAGTRVDLREIGGWTGVLDVLVVLVVGGGLKVGGAMLLGRLGGLPRTDALLVGVGMNLKGGTDVIVALVGTELGFFPNSVYSVYGTAAVLTVAVSAPLLNRLDARTVPSPAETDRLRRESAASSAYVAALERVLVLDRPGDLLAHTLAALGGRRERLALPFDTVSHRAAPASGPDGPPVPLGTVPDRVDLVAVSWTPPGADAGRPGLGHLSRTLVGHHRDVLVAVDAAPTEDPPPTPGTGHVPVPGPGDGDPPAGPRRILVPFDGRPSSFAAVDVAVVLAEHGGAEVVPFRVRHAPVASTTRPDPAHHDGATAMDEVLRQRADLGPLLRSMVVGAPDVAAAIREAVRDGDFDLVVLGTTVHQGTSRSVLGRTVDGLLLDPAAPTLVVVQR